MSTTKGFVQLGQDVEAIICNAYPSFISATLILQGCRSIIRHLVINLASVSVKWMVSILTAKGLERLVQAYSKNLQNLNIFDIHNIITSVFGYELSYVEFLGTLFGLISVWFAAKENIMTWSTGLINVICFFAIFYQVNLYSDMFLQFYFFITSVYGWVTWRNQNKKAKPISLLTNKQRIVTLFIIVCSTIFFGFFVRNIHLLLPRLFSMPASYPFADTFIAVSSVVATVLLAKRILENWFLWITIDIISVFVYAKKHIYFISIEYAIFFLLASYGLFRWIKTINYGNRLSVRKV